MRIAVVFPRANRRAGVERVAWDVSNWLGSRHTTTFIGLDMEEAGGNSARFHPISSNRLRRSTSAFRSAATRALQLVRPDVTLTLGAECPPGDVCWVQSVHAAYVERSEGPLVRGRRQPPWTRLLLARHRRILSAERRYFASTSPRTLLCTSQQEVDDLVRYHGVDAKKCQIMPNGFDPAIFNPARRSAERARARRDLGLDNEDFSLLFVANELHRKGFGTLIDALACINMPTANLHVVGRVSPGDYERRIDRLGLRDRIHWHGSTPDILPFYAAADVLVLPTQYEPFGIVIVESLASGLPVITSRLAGASAAVDALRSGRLLNDPTDPEELANYLAEAADPAIRGRWAEHACEAAAPYAWPNILSRVEAVLDQVAHKAHLSGT